MVDDVEVKSWSGDGDWYRNCYFKYFKLITMIETIIPDPNQDKSFYHMFSAGDYEYHDAYEQLRLMSMIPMVRSELRLLGAKGMPFSLAVNKVIWVNNLDRKHSRT